MENVECLICYAQAHNPSLCAQCSKVFCDSCLQTHFKRNTRTCPHCRASVGQKANGFVNVKWLPELMEDVGGSSVVARVETCQLHRPKQKTIFCADCKLTCCLDCSKVEHSNHRLEAIELAHDAMRENIFSLYHNAKAVEKVEDYSRRQYEEILALREEGQRRFAKLEEDLRRRLDSEIEALQTSLIESRPKLVSFIHNANPLRKTIDSRLDDPVLNRLLDVTPTLDKFARLVDDAIDESLAHLSSFVVPDSLPPIQISQNWL